MNISHDMHTVRSVLRTRISLHDGVFLCVVVCAGALFALEYEFFENLDHMTSREKRVTVQECFALAALLIVGLIVFAFRGLQQQKRELARRLEAELAAHSAEQEALR